MNALDVVFDRWWRRKSASAFHRLSASLTVAHEFRGSQWGHPSSYASIQIVAQPADDLMLEFAANHPTSVANHESLLRAVELAVVDELVASEWYPFGGCHLVVREVGWDEVMSSEVALYKATRGALARLRQEGAWEIIARKRSL